MTSAAHTSHIGSCLSCADILAALYGSGMRFDPKRPEWEDRDRLIVSKGHAAAVVYGALAEAGFIDAQELSTYCQNGSRLFGHVTAGVPGIEFSTGSLGHGLPVACGMALAAKRDRRPSRVFVLMSDGECDEGSNWEAILFASHHHLDNVVAIVDYNGIQSLGPVDETLKLEPMVDKWRAFGWAVTEVDGHNLKELQASLDLTNTVHGRPAVVIAHTVKGKGVRFMEGQVAWHYKFATSTELEEALREIGAE